MRDGVRGKPRGGGGAPSPGRPRRAWGARPGRGPAPTPGRLPSCRDPHLRAEGEVPGPDAEDERLAVRIGEQENVVTGRLRVEVDPGPAREPYPLNVGSVLVPDEEDERSTRRGVFELYVDLARGRGEMDLEPDRGDRFEDEEPRKVGERGRHGGPRAQSKKTSTLQMPAGVGVAVSPQHPENVKSLLAGPGTMAATRTAQAVWESDLLRGHGSVQGTSGGLPSVSVSWSARTEASGGRTSPEELLAAAHASCYSMALSAGLGRMQHPPAKLEVSATATFDKVGDGWKVTKMELSVVGHVPGISADEFRTAAEAAGAGCPISGALKGNVPVSVTARLA